MQKGGVVPPRNSHTPIRPDSHTPRNRGENVWGYGRVGVWGCGCGDATDGEAFSRIAGLSGCLRRGDDNLPIIQIVATGRALFADRSNQACVAICLNEYRRSVAKASVSRTLHQQTFRCRQRNRGNAGMAGLCAFLWLSLERAIFRVGPNLRRRKRRSGDDDG